uniref:UDP-glucose 4-epimerase family protein n=1 Tax=Vibrio sp. Vb339 TaxID=1192013 RepID=UPI0015537BB0|nr:SDR family oxidoreductase [Vibrio sp. Vb339]
MKILLTGKSGFLGGHLLTKLHEKKYDIVSVVRSRNLSDDNSILIPSINGDTNYSTTMLNCECVIHCAARVHVMNDSVINQLEKYRETNARGTINLARQAAIAGVKRFVYLSSIKVNGESTELNSPYTAADEHSPVDGYGLSKSEAENALIAVGKETGMDIVIIRPTLVYGPGVKANFASLLNLVSKGIPLPFGCINDNYRSLVSVTNLVDLIITCIEHPKAANQTFLVSDDHDVSTSEMVLEMAKALGKPQWQIPVPKWCYQLVGKLFSKSGVVNRLTGSLQVDINHTKETLNWTPPQSLDDGFKETAQAFLQSKQNQNL